MTIQKKILILMASIYPFFAVLGILGIRNVEVMGRRSLEVIDALQRIQALQNAEVSLQQCRTMVQQPAFGSTVDDQRRVSLLLVLAHERVAESMTVLERRPVHDARLPDQHAALVRTHQQVLNARALLARATARATQAGEADPAQQAAIVGELSRQLEHVIASLMEMRRVAQDAAPAALPVPFQVQRNLVASLALMTMVLVLIGCAVGNYVGHSIAKPIRDLTVLTTMIASMRGDLTRQMPSGGRDELGQLAAAFNAMLRNLRGLVRQVRDAALAVVGSTQQIHEAAQVQARGAREQTQTVTDVTAQVRVLAEAARRITADAQAVARVAQEALIKTQSGRQAATEAVQGMDAIQREVQLITQRILLLGEKSRTIGEVSIVIEDLSKQTDVLALNARIEAVKAGEAGRGFARVAQEVRRLAERSALATAEITSLLSETQQEIARVVAAAETGRERVARDIGLVGVLGASMGTIAGQVERTAQAAGNISHAAQEQQRVSEATEQAMARIGAITTNVVAATEATVQQADQLRELAVALRGAIGELKVDDHA